MSKSEQQLPSDPAMLNEEGGTKLIQLFLPNISSFFLPFFHLHH